MIEKKHRENENLTALKSQMKDMSAAFEVLKNTRIENKRKMEKKFDDTYAEIRENKEFTIASMNHGPAPLKKSAIIQTLENKDDP